MKRIFFLILISALLMCNGCNIFKENIISTEIDKTEQDTTDSKYQTLDTDLLDREFLEVGGIELLELGMNEYLSRYTSSEGTFTISGADVTNDLPEELVTMSDILLHDWGGKIFHEYRRTLSVISKIVGCRRTACKFGRCI